MYIQFNNTKSHLMIFMSILILWVAIINDSGFFFLNIGIIIY